MDVMNEAVRLAEHKADDTAENQADQRKRSREQRSPQNDESTNSSYTLESFSSEPPKISISVPEDHATGRDVPIELNQLIRDTNGYVQAIKREIRVSLDHKTGNTIVAVIEGNERNVIRAIPKEKTLDVEHLITAPAGMLFRAQA